MWLERFFKRICLVVVIGRMSDNKITIDSVQIYGKEHERASESKVFASEEGWRRGGGQRLAAKNLRITSTGMSRRRA